METLFPSHALRARRPERQTRRKRDAGGRRAT
jgi:hypothetical protein